MVNRPAVVVSASANNNVADSTTVQQKKANETQQVRTTYTLFRLDV